MPELEPITREEKFLNGEVGMTPITREEKILAGEDIETVTRREYFLKKYRGGGGGDVTVVPLSVTDNGTYSEEGKAYSPVSVNVPLPTNAYLLKSVTTPTAIASFSDGEEMVMPTLKVAIEPQQEGSGDPSPTNIRPISGWSSVNVANNGTNQWDEEWEHKKGYSSGNMLSSDTNIASKNYISCKPSTAYYFKIPSTLQIYLYQYDSNKDFIKANAVNSSESLTTESNTAFLKFASKNDGYRGDYNNDISINYPSTDTDYHAYNGQTYTIDLDGTRYGGELDVVSGVLTVDRAYFKYIDVSTTSGTAVTDGWRCNFTCPIDDINRGKWSIQTGAIPIFNKISSVAKGYGANEYTVTLPNVTSKQEADAMLEGLEICYKLATPLTIQLSPTQVKSLLGSNNVWADTGDITDAEYFSKEV